MSSQRLGKYACLEIERRYLLRRPPAGLISGHEGWRVVDRYLANTRLRLRRMTSISGQTVILKLGQKYRAEAQGPTQTTMTNMYLDEAEYNCLARLEAKEVIKTHYNYEHRGRIYRLAVFEGIHQGLVLAEIECETIEACAGLSTPAFALKDVTGDPFFTGGVLAGLSKKAFRQGLTERLSN